MPSFGRRHRLLVAAASSLIGAFASPSQGQVIAALPDQTSHIRLSNHDVNHIICVGGEIEEVKFSAEKGLAVERAGPDAWVKFLVKETDDSGTTSRTYVTAPSEFFVSCNGSIYPLYAEPSDIPAQTVSLLPGSRQRAKANEALLGPLVEEERAVSIALSLLQDRIPASFAEVAPRPGTSVLPELPAISLTERRRLDVEGSGLSASEYVLTASTAITLDERSFLNRVLGTDIFAVTLDRLSLDAGASARLIIVRRGLVQ